MLLRWDHSPSVYFLMAVLLMGDSSKGTNVQIQTGGLFLSKRVFP